MEQQETSNVLDVVMRHSAAVAAAQLDEVIKDYTEDSAIITADQTFRGLVEIRAFWQGIFNQFPREVLQNITLIRHDIHNDLFYMTYKAEPVVKGGTDCFLVRNGKIIVQTIYLVMA